MICFAKKCFAFIADKSIKNHNKISYLNVTVL